MKTNSNSMSSTDMREFVGYIQRLEVCTSGETQTLALGRCLDPSEGESLEIVGENFYSSFSASDCEVIKRYEYINLIVEKISANIRSNNVRIGINDDDIITFTFSIVVIMILVGSSR